MTTKNAIVRKRCTDCNKDIEVHREGWFYDHEKDGEMCPGSGRYPTVVIQPKKIKVRWPLEVCKTCHRRAIWPFCEHYNGVDGSWFKTIWVTGMIEPRLDGKEHDAR